MMKDTAFLINTSRGAVINESALVKGLKENWIQGAALDVFENEPQIHPELINLKNVVIVPHIGSATKETREKMAMMAAQNIIDVLRNKKPQNLVNKDVWERRRS
ncbi:MAG: 2-hydroxyacid dehydrogenase, partial [bacterium]